jgi:hypothetical protein
MTPEERLQLRKKHSRHVFEVLTRRCDALVQKPWLGRAYKHTEASPGERPCVCETPLVVVVCYC